MFKTIKFIFHARNYEFLSQEKRETFFKTHEPNLNTW